MTPEKTISEEQLKKNRRMAIILGVAMSIALISIVYAFVQKGIADENLRVARETMKLADSVKVQLQHCNEIADLNRKIAELAMKKAGSLHSLPIKK